MYGLYHRPFLMSSMRLKKGKCKRNLTSVDVDVHVSIITCMKKYFRQRLLFLPAFNIYGNYFIAEISLLY